VRTPLLAALLLLAACGSSPPARFYSLEPLAAGEAPVGAVAHLAIGPISLPDALDRSQLVTRLQPFEVQVDEFARWAEPLDRAVARVLGANLGALLDAKWVASVPGDGAAPDALRVSVQVLRFEADAKSSTLEARWQVWSGKAGEPIATRKSTCVAEWKGTDAASAAAAMSENLAQLAREVATMAIGPRPNP
jgi:uncharacterized lipoprotein YmbA